MSTEPLGLVGVSPLVNLPFNRMSKNDFDTIDDIFFGSSKQKTDSLAKMDDIKRVFIEGQDNVNHFLNAVRGIRKAVEVFRGKTLASTEFFNIFKLAAALGVISDTIETTDEIAAAIEAKNAGDRVGHTAGAAGLALSAFGNLWVFCSGVNYLKPLGSHFVSFMDKAGPVSWGLSAVMLINIGWRYHIVDSMGDRLEQAQKGEGWPLKFYQTLLREDNKPMKTPSLMFSLQLMHRVPVIESKYHMKQKIKTIAENYFVTGKLDHTQKLANMTNKQVKLARIFLGVKAAALICGIVASAFFYFPALKSNPHIGWILVAGGGIICIGNIAFGKYNSVVFMKELDKLAKEAKVETEKAMQAYFDYIDALQKATEAPEFIHSTIMKERDDEEMAAKFRAVFDRISDKVA